MPRMKAWHNPNRTEIPLNGHYLASLSPFAGRFLLWLLERAVLAIASNLCEKFHQASVFTPFLATTARTKSVELVTEALGRQSKITFRGT